jgi:hypothetical protein
MSTGIRWPMAPSPSLSRCGDGLIHNEDMTTRTTIDIPGPLHAALRHRAAQSHQSMRALILRAIEQTYGTHSKHGYVTGPLIKRKRGAKVGPLYPKDENPHDLVLS